MAILAGDSKRDVERCKKQNGNGGNQSSNVSKCATWNVAEPLTYQKVASSLAKPSKEERGVALAHGA